MVFLKKAMYSISLNKYYTKKLLYFLTDFYLMQKSFNIYIYWRGETGTIRFLQNEEV